jgi:regulator of sigma E protease
LPFTASSLSALPELGIVLGIMVLVHELGHFIVAKACGVRVQAFAIGFGKRLFGVVHNGTDYCVNLIPLGGYVKMAGELPGEATNQWDSGEFTSHPRWQRVLIALAGPMANFILAFVLLAGLYMAHYEVPAYVTHVAVADYISPNSPIAKTGMSAGDTIASFDGHANPSWEDVENQARLNLNQTAPFSYLHNGQRVGTSLFVQNKGAPEDFDFQDLGFVPVMQFAPVEVSSLPDPSTPAARAGLQPKDKIVAVDGQPVHSVFALVALLNDQHGQPVKLAVERPQASGTPESLSIAVTPYLADTPAGKAYRLGFVNMAPPVTVQHMPFGKAAVTSYHDNLKNSLLIFDVLHRLFTRQVSVKSLSSPIGIGVQVHEAFAMAGWAPIVETMAMISLNLGIFNLLPIPILDGGMIVFLFIESLLRRDLNPLVKERVYQVAFVCLILFAAVVIFNDITKYIPSHLKT